MKCFSKTEVSTIYNRLVDSAKTNYEAGNLDESLKYIISSALWMYHFNVLYSDYGIETIIKDISVKCLPKVIIDSPKPNRVVLIDNFGYDNRGLTQQYLRGFMKLGYEILYILHNSNPNGNSDIIHELQEYDRASVRIFKTNNKNLIETAKEICLSVKEFSPKDILLHIAPWDVVSLMAVNSISGSTVYNINLTDHAFWLGASFIDYNIEFRGYGEVLSLEKRGLNPSQLIRLPYYPIVPKHSTFLGFPQLPAGSIKVFCGGSEYKMLGKGGIFFKLMDAVLGLSNDVHILVAGVDKDSTFQKFVERMLHKERVHIIGVRKDINEVFSHSDVYLGSYPLPGGLMTQYAALNKLPILLYAEPGESNSIEAVVNHFSSPLKSRRSIGEFLDYARRLISDAEYRKKEGLKCHDAMMNKDKFSIFLEKTLMEHNTGMKWDMETPDYDYMISYYLDVENTTHTAIRLLFGHLRFKSIRIAPFAIPLMIKLGALRMVRKLQKLWQKS